MLFRSPLEPLVKISSPHLMCSDYYGDDLSGLEEKVWPNTACLHGNWKCLYKMMTSCNERRMSGQVPQPNQMLLSPLS